MRKLFSLIVLLTTLIVASLAQASQVTDVKWGVDKYNMLRFVVDLTEPASYQVKTEANSLLLTIDAELQAGVAGKSKIKSSITNEMVVSAEAGKTLVRVPLNRALAADGYKSFTLKKDPQTKRPPRVVLDITATRTAEPAAVVVSNKPTPKSTSVAKPVPEVKPTPTVKNTSEKKSKSQAKPAAKKTTDNKDDLVVVKGSGQYRVNGGLKGKVITIDPGHGGSDPGAIGKKGTMEKDVTLRIAKLVKEGLEQKGAKVYMTRSSDVDVFGAGASDKEELQARVNIAEKRNSDLFISIHINASENRELGGISSYYYPKTEYDAKIADAIQKQMIGNFGVEDLGIRQAGFYVIKRCSMPATLLELCFISNPKEEAFLRGQWFHKKASKLIVNGIADYFE